MIYIIIIIVGAIIGFAIYKFEEAHPKSYGEVDGIVEYKNYVPELNSTGVGPTFGGGHLGVAVVSSHEDEKWILVCKIDNSIHPFEVEKELWARYEKGDKIKIRYSQRLGYDKTLIGVL